MRQPFRILSSGRKVLTQVRKPFLNLSFAEFLLWNRFQINFFRSYFVVLGGNLWVQETFLQSQKSLSKNNRVADE